MLRLLFRIFGLMLLLLVGAVAWWFRDPILHAASRWFGPRRTALPPVADTAVGAPTQGALSSGHAKLAALGRSGGPDSVVLTPNEMASLIGSGMDWAVRKNLDTLRVELLDGVLAVHARLDTRTIPKESLGPLALMVQPVEPIRIAGRLTIERPGRGRWTVTELSLRGFPFPGPAVTALARQVAGADTSGAIIVKVDSAIADVAVRPTGVVCFRKRRG